MKTQNTVKRTPRKRAVAAPKSQVAKSRNQLYKEVFGRIKQASIAGFHLEAITLIESLISDRLESRYSFLTGRNVGFQTLGYLIELCKSHEIDGEVKTLVITRLDSWRRSRNEAIHEMAKIAEGESVTWSDRVANLVPLVTEGLKILRSVDRRVTLLRK